MQLSSSKDVFKKNNLLKSIKKIVFFIIVVNMFSCQSQQDRVSVPTGCINKLDSFMTTLYDGKMFNGNVLVSKNNEIVYQKSFGFLDGNQEVLLDSSSVFNIGSIAKQYNGVAIMMLQERGLLSIDDTISKFDLDLPEWSEKVTISHLLNYASGVPCLDVQEYPKNDAEAWNIMRNTDTLLFEPGSRFYYDNGNVFLQKRIVEKVTGQSFQHFIADNIIEPLALKRTVMDPGKDYLNRASCYGVEKKDCPEFDFISGWPWQDINDLYTWVESMNSNMLVSQKSFNTLGRNPYALYKTSSLGEYFEKDGLQRHDGTAIKFRSIVLNDLKNDVVVIVLVNTPTNVKFIGYALLDMVLDKPLVSTYNVLKEESAKSVDLGIEAYKDLKENYSDHYRLEDPGDFNKVGYELYRSKVDIKEVIKFFEFAVSQIPDSNLYDSLAEMYFKNEQYDLALLNYKKAVELGGTAGNARSMIVRLNGM